VSGNTGVPYVQNWNLSVSLELSKSSVLEVAYVGSKGTHLFMPRINANPRDLDFVEALEVAGGTQNADTTIVDPLGRRNLIGGAISVPRGSLGSKFLGFNSLFTYFDASASSIR